MNYSLLKLKNLIKNKFPKIFKAIKKVLISSFVWPWYKRIRTFIFPPTERYDPFDPNAETDYFNSYSNFIINNSAVSGRVLDIGCGFGYLTEKIAHKSKVKEIFAVDKISPSNFRFLNNQKIKYFQRDITKISDNFSYFDVIVSTEFIEHISEQDFISLLSWIKNSLKPRGVFIGSTPTNKTSLLKFSDSPFHIREYQPDVLKKILLDNGFKTVELKVFDDFFIWEAKL